MVRVRVLLTSIMYCLIPLGTAAAFDLEVSATRSQMSVGWPLSVSIKIGLNPPERGNAHAVVISGEDVDVSVYDATGVRVCQGNVASPSCTEQLTPSSILKLGSNGLCKRSFAFSQCCGDLPPGSYVVVVSVSKLSILDKGVSVARLIQPAVPVESRFSLNVLESNEEAVEAEFAQLMQIASQDIRPELRSADSARRTQAIDLIVYSKTPAALPYQILLLRGDVPFSQGAFDMCRLLDLSKYFIEEDDPEIARELIALLDDYEIGRTNVAFHNLDRFRRVVLWTIHEMHSKGKSTVVSVTDDVVSASPKPDQPFPQQNRPLD